MSGYIAEFKGNRQWSNGQKDRKTKGYKTARQATPQGYKAWLIARRLSFGVQVGDMVRVSDMAGRHEVSAVDIGRWLVKVGEEWLPRDRVFAL